MRAIIAGSRTATFGDVQEALSYCPFTSEISVVIFGKARGADTHGETWARLNCLPIEEFPADWFLGKKAGHIRNEAMGKRGEALVAVWDGMSRGTKNMIDLARELGLRVFVYRFEPSMTPPRFLNIRGIGD